MTIAGGVAWARRRIAAEWLALGAGVAVFGYLAWDSGLWDARIQLVLHLAAVGAILGAGGWALRGGALPRTRMDLPLLGMVAAFALATVSAQNVGMSLRAMGSITAFACMLPIAILAVRHRPSWVGYVTVVPVLILAVPTLLTLLDRRLEWILVGAPGLPPLRLPGEGTPFGSVAVPPFVLLPAWALAGLIQPAGARRVVRGGILVVAAPLVVLSGSRSAWLAIAAAVLIGVVPWAWRRRDRLRQALSLSARGILAGVGLLALAALVAVLVVPRATAVTSLLYRAALWRDTLAAWSSDPLLGIGPGFMPYARQAAAADHTFPVRQPHSHNLPLGVLGDAGMVGLVAGAILVVTLIALAGPWRSRTPTGRIAAFTLVGLGVGGLFEDLTFLPGFNLLAITLVAVVLLDVGAVDWVRPAALPPARRLALGVGTTAIGTVLVGAMVMADAGAIAYRAGMGAAAGRAWTDAERWVARAVDIDPWHPAGPRALAVVADEAGDPALARLAAERATQFNRGDAVSWTNLAVLCLRDGDRECAVRAAERAAATAQYRSIELVNAALVLDAAGRTAPADAAYRLSLLTQPLTSFAVPWPRHVAIGDGRISDFTDGSWQLNVLLARRANGEAIMPEEFEDVAVRAMAHAIANDRDEAETLLTQAIATQAADPRTWELAVAVRDAWGEPIDDEVRIAGVVRGRRLPDRDAPIGSPGLAFDIASFRTYPLGGFVRDAVRLGTRPPYPWVLESALP
jgi:hypothetical protein